MNELGDLVGSIEEHEANYRRLVHDMESFRSQHNLEEGFPDRLAHATDLVRNLVPIRCVNLSMAKKIAENDGVYSLRNAVEEGLAPEKKHGDGRGMSVADIKYGLDRFIYAGFGRTIAYGRDDYGEIPILFQHETMDKEDTVCVPSDFLLLSGGNFDHYKNHVIRGRRFRDFMANVIATFFREPSDYLTVDFETQPKALKWVDFCFGSATLRNFFWPASYII